MIVGWKFRQLPQCPTTRRLCLIFSSSKWRSIAGCIYLTVPMRCQLFEHHSRVGRSSYRRCSVWCCLMTTTWPCIESVFQVARGSFRPSSLASIHPPVSLKLIQCNIQYYIIYINNYNEIKWVMGSMIGIEECIKIKTIQSQHLLFKIPHPVKFYLSCCIFIHTQTSLRQTNKKQTLLGTLKNSSRP